VRTGALQKNTLALKNSKVLRLEALGRYRLPQQLDFLDPGLLVVLVLAHQYPVSRRGHDGDGVLWRRDRRNRPDRPQIQHPPRFGGRESAE